MGAAPTKPANGGASSASAAGQPVVVSVTPAGAVAADLIEQLVGEHVEYQRELHDFASAALERDSLRTAAAATAQLQLSPAAAWWNGQPTPQALSQSQAHALQDALRGKLLADFLHPGARFHAQLRHGLEAAAAAAADAQRRGAGGVSPSPSPSYPLGLAAMATSPGAASSASSSTSASSAPSCSPSPSLSPSPVPAALSAAEGAARYAAVVEAIRCGVEVQVRRVWGELRLAEQYEAMGRQTDYADKEAAVQKELANTWAKLEF